MSTLSSHTRLLLVAAAAVTLPFGASGIAVAQAPDDPPGHSQSGTQGKSPSTPDQDGTGADHGVDNDDKPGGDGDVDGNNGCGNDDDREDDNNGKCGRPAGTPPGGGNPPPDVEVEVLPNVITRGTPPGTTTTAATGATRTTAARASAAVTSQAAPATAVKAQPTFTG